jgi:hypothetical protein
VTVPQPSSTHDPNDARRTALALALTCTRFAGLTTWHHKELKELSVSQPDGRSRDNLYQFVTSVIAGS